MIGALPLAQTILAAALAVIVLVAPRSPHPGPDAPAPRSSVAIRQVTIGRPFLAESGLRDLQAQMGPGGRAALARWQAKGRGDPDRPAGWRRFDLEDVPTLGFGALQGDDARRINAAIPDSSAPLEIGRAFHLPSFSTASGKRALECLSQAVYFETGRDDERAQSAVAQVVLNRVRHPAYPASVCGVVYQGALRVTGCQFSFTCDGSLKRGTMGAAWLRAQAVARRALEGFVMREVGVATNYHADYVAPYWARTLVKISRVGPHIFYRWTGPLGQRAALTKRYAGNETTIARDVLASWDERTQGVDAAVALKDAVGEGTGVSEAAVRTLQAAGLMATVDGGRVHALLNPVARKPTPEEVKAINDKLAAFEKGLDAPAAETPVSSSSSGLTGRPSITPGGDVEGAARQGSAAGSSGQAGR